MQPLENTTDHTQWMRLTRDGEGYPACVVAVMGDKAPAHLDVMGNSDLLNRDGLGFCGSRKASAQGLDVTRDCARQAAENLVIVVSGNAAGVDFAAHHSCLENGGATILVLPEGINHFRMRKDLRPVWDWSRVLVISPFNPDDPWRAFRAMARNKLIIALSKAMIVIEAGEKGGTLHAGKETLKAGLPLCVAHYQDMSAHARGNQLLLDMGAEKLSKSRTTNRANFVRVLDAMKTFPPLSRPNLPQQARLL